VRRRAVCEAGAVPRRRWEVHLLVVKRTRARVLAGRTPARRGHDLAVEPLSASVRGDAPRAAAGVLDAARRVLSAAPSCEPAFVPGGFLLQVKVSAGAGRPHPHAPWPWPRHPWSSACRSTTPRSELC
jgi:hypothetical protein